MRTLHLSSYDNRPRTLQSAEDRHIIQSASLEGRAFFHPGTVPALHINPVRKSDQANYTCRVDFRIANSLTTYLSLLVIILPSSPKLRVENRNIHGSKSVLKHLKEGERLRISCMVEGGDPPPQVVWLKNGREIDMEFQSVHRTANSFLHSSEIDIGFQSLRRTANQLFILKLPRSYHDSELTCKTYNNNFTNPFHVSVRLSMYLRPSFVEIQSPPKHMRIGTTYDVTCVTVGSQPTPNITWTLGNVASLIPIRTKTVHNNNSSLSVARLKAKRRFHGQKLTCSVSNRHFRRYVIFDSFLLNVTYPPVVALELGRGLSTDVEQGNDVYFNCLVDSNPATYKTRWYFENQILVHSPSKGVLIGGHSLALRAISRSQGGYYVCSASNIEGDARSHPMLLTIKFTPICALPYSQSKVMAAAIGISINIICHVIALPLDIKYSWVFNNSLISERVTGNRIFFTKDGRSGLQFTAQTPNDYGTFQCWAENSVGRMESPCYFHIVPAGPPASPSSCSVANKTYETLEVACQAGFDGGMRQHFEAWVFESVTGRSQLNESSDLPFLVLRGLTPGLDYIIMVNSRNQMGRSEPISLEAFTYKMAENRMKNQAKRKNAPAIQSLGGFAGENPRNMILVSLAGGISLAGFVAFFIFLMKNRISRMSWTENSPFSSSNEQQGPMVCKNVRLTVKGNEITDDISTS